MVSQSLFSSVVMGEYELLTCQSIKRNWRDGMGNLVWTLL